MIPEMINLKSLSNSLLPAQHVLIDTVSKCTASEKAFKELETVYNDHSSQANEVNKRYNQMDEESQVVFQCLQMKHQQEMQDLMQDLKLKHVMEHRKLKSEDYEKSEAIGKEYKSILDEVTYMIRAGVSTVCIVLNIHFDFRCVHNFAESMNGSSLR